MKMGLIVFFAASIISLFIGSEGSLGNALTAPGTACLLGCDTFGRPLGTLVLQGAARSCLFAASVAIIATLLSVLLGATIGISPRRLRFGFERFLELTLAFPFLLIALAMASLFGPGWLNLAMALLFATLPGTTRLMLARCREILAQEYIMAAVASGASKKRIIRRHINPELWSLAKVKFPNIFAGALLAEATLSFIGVGAPSGAITWGSLLIQGKDYLLEAPHIAIVSGFPLFVIVFFLIRISSEKRADVAS